MGFLTTAYTFVQIYVIPSSEGRRTTEAQYDGISGQNSKPGNQLDLSSFSNTYNQKI